MSNGAMTLAEGSNKRQYKTDATLVLNGVEERENILRTSFDSLPVWKSKYSVNTSIFCPRINSVIKKGAVIEKEVWVFGVDATKAQDIIDAVKIATSHYKVKASDILSKVYIKNLNAEKEEYYDLDFLVQLNKNLYRDTTAGIKEACEYFGIKNPVNIHVYSSNNNYKINKIDLYEAFELGGASQVKTDPRALVYKSMNNLGSMKVKIKTNLHVATINF